MCEVASYNLNEVVVHANNQDPTRTTTLRNAFARAMRVRFTELERIIKKAVEVNDVFALNKINTQQMYVPSPGAFDYLTSEQKVSAFVLWLEEQVENGILDVRDIEQVGKSVNGAWQNKYLFDSYKRGVQRARYELKKAGATVSGIEETGGLDVIMGLPFHVDAIGLLYIRVYNDLKGITNAMDSQISRILAQGMADGDNPRVLARKLVGTVNGDLGITDTLGRYIPAKRRAEMLARTEIIRAHHIATIQEYRNWGVEGVHVKAEWRTAGDNRVCPTCSNMQGEIFTLEEIEKMIPAHPFCRCIALPFVVR